MSDDIEYDPDFTDEEHEEFERFEAEHPYAEQPEEKIRVPKREERITDTKNDRLFLILFSIAMIVFLIIILMSGVM